MAARLLATTFKSVGNPAHRPVSGWRTPLYATEEDITPRSWQSNARAYARTYGESKVMRADGSVVRYWRDEGKVRQRTYRVVFAA